MLKIGNTESELKVILCHSYVSEHSKTFISKAKDTHI
jgi:hypothetical protein